jgi:hypothetical protein
MLSMTMKNAWELGSIFHTLAFGYANPTLEVALPSKSRLVANPVQQRSLNTEYEGTRLSG